MRSSQVVLQFMKVLKIQAQARFELLPPIDMNYQKWHPCSGADQCNHDIRQLFLIVELDKLILKNPMELMFIVFEVRFCFLDRKMRIAKSFELLYFHLRETCLYAIGISAVLLTFRFLSVIICFIVLQKKLALKLFEKQNYGGTKKVKKCTVTKL